MLGNEGHVIEQGSFKALDLTGGYISSFALGLPEQNKAAEKTSNSGKSDVQVSSVEQDEDSEVDGPGAGGDISIYLYYVKSIGWLPTLIFIIAITGFVFCISFPSEFDATPCSPAMVEACLPIINRYLDELVG